MCINQTVLTVFENAFSCQEKILKERNGKDDNTGIEDIFMDKICIVRRRIQIPTFPEKSSLCREKDREKTNELTNANAYACVSNENGKQHISPFRGVVRDEDNVLRIQLTPEQCKVVRSNGSINHFFGQILGGIDLDLERYEDGQIVFNLHLKHVQRADMLDSKGVCQMLQISRSFLSKLIRTKQIKSYKMGRLRRFLLEDILDYLTQSEILQIGIQQISSKTKKVLTEEQLGKQTMN